MRRRKYLAGAGAVCIGGAAAAGTDRSTAIERRGAAASVTIAPETTMLFEVTLPDDVEPADVEWDVGDRSGGGFVADLSHETGDAARTVHFEATGSHVVRAGHDGTTVEWDVTVAEDGRGPPTVASMTTDPGPGETIGVSDPVSVTARAADRAGELDRLVWVEGRNYTVVEITAIEGAEDAATLSLEETPHWIDFGYPTVAYPVSADGRLGEGVSSDGPTVRQPFALEIVETNAPVAAGERFSATVAVENVGDMMMVGPNTQDVSLVVGGEVVDTASVTLGWAEETTITLGYETYPVRQDVTFPVRVVGADDSDTVEIAVFADDEADDSESGSGRLSVSISRTNAPVTGGAYLEVLASIGNDGPGPVTGPVELVVGDEVVDSRTIDLPAGATETIALGYETYPVRQDVSVTLTVRSPDDAASTTIPVNGRE